MPDTKDKDEYWVFTFGQNHAYPGRCVRIEGDYKEARQKMVDYFGYHWAFQYSEKEWKDFKNDPMRFWIMETEVYIPGLSAE